MKHTLAFILTALLLVGVGSAAEIAIRTGATPSAMETLAARELRRYLYLTSGTLPVLESSERDRLTIRLELGADLGPEAFTLSASPDGGTQRIVGGGPLGLLYGTYRFIEHQGVRFLLHTDVIPDQRHAVTTVNDRGAPLFAVRGVLPFHDFSSGPDWWTRNDYLTIVSQLPKLGMNFIGFHGYPSEPLVWIGLPGEATAQGRVTEANDTGGQNTARHAGRRRKEARDGENSRRGTLAVEPRDEKSDRTGLVHRDDRSQCRRHCSQRTL